jgi:K+-transporting ATPase c subunit
MIDILNFAITDIPHLLIVILIILVFGVSANIAISGFRIADYIFLDKSNGKVVKDGDEDGNDKK